MSQRSTALVEPVQEDEVQLDVRIAGGGNGAAVAGEQMPATAARPEQRWLLAAVTGAGTEQTPAAVVSALRHAFSAETPGDDAGLAMKQVFRKINSSLYQEGMGKQTAAAVAMVSKGKYATIANIGDGRAYLMRAGRLNQITRDVSATPIKGNRPKGTIGDVSPAVPALLGSRDRLDTRQPAIYELTLLPEDRLLLCTAAVYGSMDEQAILATLASNDDQSLATLEAVHGPSSAVVALISAAHARPEIIIGSDGKTSIVPLVATLIVILIGVLGYIAVTYFF